MKRASLIFGLLLAVSGLHAQPLLYPKTPKVEHSDNYFGTVVPDPYRWMENDTAASVADWVQAENKVTFGYLEKIPFRDQVKARMTKIWNYAKYSTPFRAAESERPLLPARPRRQAGDFSRSEHPVLRWNSRPERFRLLERRQVHGVQHLPQRIGLARDLPPLCPDEDATERPSPVGEIHRTFVVPRGILL